jgi:hypothetical protein
MPGLVIGLLRAVEVIILIAIAVVIILTVKDVHPGFKMPSAKMFKEKFKTGKSWKALSRDEQRLQLTVQVTALRSVMDEIKAAMEKQREILIKYGVDPTGDTRQAVSTIGYTLADLERKQAMMKADLLLEEHLDKNQLAFWNKNRSFLVKGKKLTYLIQPGGRVSTLKPKGDFCINTTDHSQPEGDIVLGLKMFIEANEEGFLEEANWSGPEGSLIKMTIDGIPDPSRRHTGFEGGRFFTNAGLLTQADFRRYTQQGGAGGGGTVTRGVNEAGEPVYGRYNPITNRTETVDVTTFGDTTRTFMVPYLGTERATFTNDALTTEYDET